MGRPSNPANSEKPVQRFRRRRREEGYVRLDVQVRSEDAALLRSVVRVLGDPGSADAARAWLRERFASAPPGGLKALLLAAPLEGIDLERARDAPRDIDL